MLKLCKNSPILRLGDPSNVHARRVAVHQVKSTFVDIDSARLFASSRFSDRRHRCWSFRGSVSRRGWRVCRLGRTGAEARAWYRERTGRAARRHAERTQSLEARRRARVVARRCAFRVDDVYRIFALGRGCAFRGDHQGARVVDFPLEVRLERMTPCPSALDVAVIDAPRPTPREPYPSCRSPPPRMEEYSSAARRPAIRKRARD